MPSPVASFFICENPLLKFVEGLSTHIYHDTKPRFMCSLFRIDDNKLVEMNYKGLNYPFRYKRGDGKYQMYVLLVRDIIDRVTTSKLNICLEQAAGFYASCLNKTDEKTYGKGSWTIPHDHHDTMPGVKLVNIEKANAFMLFYPGGIKTFTSDQEVAAFLENTLNYPSAYNAEVKTNIL